ncbi:MAG: zinc ribbon domain-containing protein [bacterium]
MDFENVFLVPILNYLLFIIILIIGIYIYWLIMFIDALRHRESMWATLLFLSALTGVFNFLLPILYNIMVYRHRKNHFGFGIFFLFIALIPLAYKLDYLRHFFLGCIFLLVFLIIINIKGSKHKKKYQINYCGQCGEKVNKNSNYCGYCGKRLTKDKETFSDAHKKSVLEWLPKEKIITSYKPQPFFLKPFTEDLIYLTNKRVIRYYDEIFSSKTKYLMRKNIIYTKENSSYSWFLFWIFMGLIFYTIFLIIQTNNSSIFFIISIVCIILGVSSVKSGIIIVDKEDNYLKMPYLDSKTYNLMSENLQ